MNVKKIGESYDLALDGDHDFVNALPVISILGLPIDDLEAL